ncbi:DUF84 family protein [Candidatus Bipolaricaulota bacterium]|nr:DUF84 family protein [Candidatus Bipolaricaulota bacterium]
MRVLVASDNPAKLEGTRRAVEEALPGTHEVRSARYPHPLPDMPRGKEVFAGARMRACWAEGQGADLGVGIESGLVRPPGASEEFLATVTCVRGKGREGWGISAGFPFRFAGEPADPVRGYVAHLTRGRLGRADLVYQAVLLAIFSWLLVEG